LRVIMDIYGVPEEDEPLMLDLTQGIFGAADPEFQGDAPDPGTRLLDAAMRFAQYFNEVTADRRACPRDDLATVIATGEVDGRPMDDLHRFWYYVIVATAGHDTTSYALSGGMEAMLRDPEQLAALRDDPELVVNAADECVRWTSPVRHFMRYATREATVAGVTVPEGGRVLLSYPSANRDERVFRDAMTFDVRRDDADKLVAFGGGAHFCLGSQFARRELRTMLLRLSQQLAHIELDGDPEWSQSHFVSGVQHLPVRDAFRWGPPPPAAAAARCRSGQVVRTCVRATAGVDPARRPRRVLRVGRAARPPRAAGPAGDRRHRRRAGRQLRGPSPRRALGDGRPAGPAAVPGRGRRHPPPRRLRRGQRGGVRRLPAHDAGRRAAVDRRGLPRRRRAR